MLNISKRFIDSDYDISEARWCFDRAASNAFKGAAANAGNLATQEGSNANAAGAALTPFYRQEMNAQHLYTPGQTNELLGAAGAPIASSLATAQGQAASQAARTRNTSGFSSALDEAARNRNQAMGAVGQGVAAQDVMGAKQLNQEGAAGMSGLYGIDTNAQLQAMGLQNKDISGQMEAGKSGWLQNLEGAVGMLNPGYSKKGGFTLGG